MKDEGISLEQEIEELEDKAIRHYVKSGVPDGEKNMATYQLYRTRQLIGTIRDSSESANNLTRKIRALNIWLVIIGGLAVIVGIANLIVMIFSICPK